MDVRVARIFNTFGPRMHMNDGRVVSNFIIQALQNQPMTVTYNFFLLLSICSSISISSACHHLNSWKQL